jgi:hypothetical protein
MGLNMHKERSGRLISEGPTKDLIRRLNAQNERIEALEDLVSRMTRLEMAFQSLENSVSAPRKPGRPKKVA